MHVAYSKSRTPDIGYDFATNSGNPFRYFTFGAGNIINLSFTKKY